MPPRSSRNFAFIDGQNLYLGLRESGIILDYRRFRIYLRERLQIAEAYYFIGFIPEHQALYTDLQRAGFILRFKTVARGVKGKAKGNVDVDLTLHVVDKIAEYDQAVLVTNDGDFASLPLISLRKTNFARYSVPTGPNAPISYAVQPKGTSITLRMYVRRSS